MSKSKVSTIADQAKLSPVVVSLVAGVLSIGVVTGLYVRSAASEASETRVPLTVSASQVLKQDSYFSERWFSGRIQARQRVQLTSELAGQAEQIFVDEGDFVESGTELISLDTDLLVSERASIESQISGIDAELELANLRLSRQSNLKQKGFSSVDTVDEIQSAITNFKSRRNTLVKQMETLDVRIEKSIIKAPFDAIVQSRLIDKGSIVNSQTPLFDLVERANPEIKFGIPVSRVRELVEGSIHQVQVNNATFEAKLLSIAPAVDLTTQTVAVRFELLADLSEISLGDFAELNLKTEFKRRGFWIPNTALIEGERGLWTVYLVNQQNSIEQYAVQIITTENERSFVTSSLPNESLIVDSGLNRIAPNMQVTLNR